jgi:hypothetical protein
MKNTLVIVYNGDWPESAIYTKNGVTKKLIITGKSNLTIELIMMNLYFMFLFPSLRLSS